MLFEDMIEPVSFEVHILWEQQAINEVFYKNHILTCYSLNQNWFSAPCLIISASISITEYYSLSHMLVVLRLISSHMLIIHSHIPKYIKKC